MKTKDPSYRALLQLGEQLRELTSERSPDIGAKAAPPAPVNTKIQNELEALLNNTRQNNPWFTEESCMHALRYWAGALSEDTLERWLSPYDAPGSSPRIIALIMAGNIPLVGFHDLISVLLTGHKALVKCASKDTLLLKYLVSLLTRYEPGLTSRIRFTDGKLGAFDAVIATGSTNTSRYFEYYFSKKPHIIRKNRHGVAVLSGQETPAELSGLAEDVFRYFGMGCRSVSKLYVPKGYDFDPLFKAFYPFKYLIDHQKYGNNYDYNKAVYLMSGSPMLDNGFLLLKEDPGLGSPIGTLFYESYEEQGAVVQRLIALKDEIQCIVGGSWLSGAIPFGSAQRPELGTYADGVDTVDFLLKTSAESPSAI
ncbi:MAG: acyl-CoA reductase [Robiginitalea sp.]|uniref:acyl-CoA reductase n=1 Tax=Robiginitalea sp. TaxID=1902411 RepID=UPI003C769C76